MRDATQTEIYPNRESVLPIGSTLFLFLSSFSMPINPVKKIKRKTEMPQHTTFSSFMTDFSVVRQLPAPSDLIVLLYTFRNCLSSADAPTQSSAYISDFRCRLHRRNDVHLPCIYIIKLKFSLFNSFKVKKLII